jgi:hypothetical protein
MRRTIGRRAAFFAIMAAVCAVLIPVTPPEFRWVAWFATGLASFWALALGAEDVARGAGHRHVWTVPTAQGTPFDPPAPPATVRPRRRPSREG